MENILIFIGIICVWLILQIYILPKFGISTWMREACQVTGKEDQDKQVVVEEKKSWLFEGTGSISLKVFRRTGCVITISKVSLGYFPSAGKHPNLLIVSCLKDNPSIDLYSTFFKNQLSCRIEYLKRNFMFFWRIIPYQSKFLPGACSVETVRSSGRRPTAICCWL